MTNTRRYALELILAFTIAFVATTALRVSGACAQQNESRSSFTDRAGRFSGSSVTHGNQTDIFDRNGRYQGTTTQQGTSSNPLGNVDGSRPFGGRR